MISLNRVSSFVKSYIKDDEGELGRIYREACENGVPVIRPETRELIKTQLILTKPRNVLEIGTAVGYSSLYMCRYLSADAHITTMELSEERVAKAMENISLVGEERRITVMQGDAAELLKTLPDAAYDFAFVDAAKGQYIFYLPELLRIVQPGGLIISDNILQDGAILESHFAVEKRDRTIHDRMREYLYTLCNDDRLDTAILSVADGVALSVRR
jgi:predicted O-methyltransferase YrrM